MNKRWLMLVIGAFMTLVLSYLWPKIDRAPHAQEVALSLLASEQPEDALVLLEEPMWRGVAEYRAGRFERAIEEFDPAQSALALYNIGTSFAQLEDWSSAITALEKVLRLEPDHADARHNLAVALEAQQLETNLVSEREREPELAVSDGEKRQQPRAQEGEAAQARPSGSDEENSKSARAMAQNNDGSSAKPGRLSEKEQTERRGNAVATGDPKEDEESQAKRRSGGTAELKARESQQAAEILLQQIRDDPEKVLRVRLHTVHKHRQGGLTQ